jgi:hypothetical protein
MVVIVVMVMRSTNKPYSLRPPVREPLLGAILPVTLQRAGVDDLDVDVVSLADRGELGRNARQAHPELFRDLDGVDLREETNVSETRNRGRR